MAVAHSKPAVALPSMAPGGINELAVSMAGRVAQVALASQFADARVGTLQHIPAPICHADVIPPFPYPSHPLVPMPGDPGANATIAQLEDR